MPLYEYERQQGTCDICPGRFCLLRDIDAPPLTHCPKCLQPVNKVLSRLSAVTTAGDRLDDRKIAEAGMAKYVKKADGYYVREAGSTGPASIGQEPT